MRAAFSNPSFRRLEICLIRNAGILRRNQKEILKIERTASTAGIHTGGNLACWEYPGVDFNHNLRDDIFEMLSDALLTIIVITSIILLH